MKFIIAKRELARLAKGKVFDLQYELLRFTSGEEAITCKIYIEGHDFHSGPTWKDALAKIRQAIKERETLLKIDPEEAP